MGDDDFPTRLAAATGDDGDGGDGLPPASSVVAGLLRPLRGAARSNGGRRYETAATDRSAKRWVYTTDISFCGVECTSKLVVFRRHGYVYAYHGLEPESDGGLLARFRGADSEYDAFDVDESAVDALEERRRELAAAGVVGQVTAVQPADGPAGFKLRFETGETSMMDAQSFTDGRDYVQTPLPDLALTVTERERGWLAD
jgi:hypothetical protein